MYYFANIDGDFCDFCDYSCLSCSYGGNDNCTSCPNATFRTLNNNTCYCDDGYYDNSVAICSQCDSACLTCYTTSTNCLSCDSTENRVLSGSDCVCDSSFI